MNRLPFRAVTITPTKERSGYLDALPIGDGPNTSDAMPNGGCIAIRLEPVQVDADRVQSHIDALPGAFVCLSVTDNGCGMDEATLKRVFEPFFTTKEPGKGTGLGLATVYGIATQHKGWVEAASELGKGTTFRVFLPATFKVPFFLAAHKRPGCAGFPWGPAPRPVPARAGPGRAPKRRAPESSG